MIRDVAPLNRAPRTFDSRPTRGLRVESLRPRVVCCVPLFRVACGRSACLRAANLRPPTACAASGRAGEAICRSASGFDGSPLHPVRRLGLSSARPRKPWRGAVPGRRPATALGDARRGNRVTPAPYERTARDGVIPGAVPGVRCRSARRRRRGDLGHPVSLGSSLAPAGPGVGRRVSWGCGGRAVRGHTVRVCSSSRCPSRRSGTSRGSR